MACSTRATRLPDIGITHRRTAISTVGWIPGIERLTAEPVPLRLALSLHAADDALRSELMPVNDRYPLADVLAACERLLRAQAAPSVRRVRDARRRQRLARAGRPARRRARPRVFKVNLIPYNPTGFAVRGLEPEGDRGVQGRARAPRDRGDRAAHPRARDRRGVRAARGAGSLTRVAPLTGSRPSTSSARPHRRSHRRARRHRCSDRAGRCRIRPRSRSRSAARSAGSSRPRRRHRSTRR